jgi:TolB protein
MGSASAVSPDGKLVVMDSGGGEFPPRNIYVMRSDGSSVRQLTRGNYWETDPAWSPDGQWIVFATTRCCATPHSSGRYALYAIRPDGSGLHRLDESAGNELAPAWSPDGTRIAYVHTAADSTDPEIWVMDANGSGAHALTHEHRIVDAVTWSPDGTQLAYISHLIDEGDWQIRVMQADGTGAHALYSCSSPCTSGGYTLAWSPDGTAIAFTIEPTRGPPAKPQIALVRTDGTAFDLLDTHSVGACCMSWIPRGAEP